MDDLEVSSTFAKSTASWHVVRRSAKTLPDGTSVFCVYNNREGADDIWDDDVSRVTDVKVNTLKVARYWYSGLGQVVGTEYPEPEIMWEQQCQQLWALCCGWAP